MIRDLGSVKTATQQTNGLTDLEQLTPPEFFFP